MKSELATLGLVLVLSALIFHGCESITESPTATPTSTPAEAPEGVVAARDAALTYVTEHYGEEAPASDLPWAEKRTTPEGLVGLETYEYTAEDWVIMISYPVVAPEKVVYEVVVANETTGFQWEGEVDAAGEVTMQSAQPVVAWYGRVVSLPAGAQFDDYLILLPEGAGEVGLTGADAAIEAEIERLRDKEEPERYAHFWGTFTCDVPDDGGCQLVVTRLRPEGPGPSFEPEAVEGWEGTIVSNPRGTQFDDYFALAGDFPVGYGIGSSNLTLAAQLEDLRDTQTAIRVWGQVTCPAIDSYGTHIKVNRIEIEGES